MPRVHFLNVRNGDCSIIEHVSRRVTVIDVCNATLPLTTNAALLEAALTRYLAAKGNHNQKDYPVNPIAYMAERGISSVFRFILTHPDMDHMDGLRDFFQAFSPACFWDTENLKEMDFEGSPYDEADWDFYRELRGGVDH